MPLPLVPVVFGGLAALAGTYGAKKGYDAYRDNSEANDLNQKASSSFEEAQKSLNVLREQTDQQFKELGELKLEVYKEVLPEFVDIFSQIKNIEYDSSFVTDLGLVDAEYEDLLEIKEQVLKIQEIAGGTIAAIGSGALAGFGAFGGAGMFAAASTGTAISTLSGVAATNATLAWFGGGSLAAGGLGMAGGMAVLGGIVTAPILAVTGGMLAAKAEEKKFVAQENLNRSNAMIAEIDAVKVAVSAIKARAEEFIRVLTALVEVFDDAIDELEKIVRRGSDYSQYSDDQKKTVLISLSIASTVKNLCDTPIIDEEGEITRKSRRVLRKTRDFVSNLAREK